MILEVTFLSRFLRFVPKVLVMLRLYFVSQNMLRPLVFAGVK